MSANIEGNKTMKKETKRVMRMKIERKFWDVQV